MRGDFTRFTFDPLQHYRRVYDQQGRVAVDSDANEREDIAAHLRAATLADVVGPAGAPLDGAGFAIEVAGPELHISAGRLYAGGQLAENDEECPIHEQPHLPPGAPIVVGGESPAEGTYLAFLETWERLITAIEDDRIREVALGGPDTTTRTQSVWQVRLLRVGGVDAAVECAGAIDALTAPSDARMQARGAVSEEPAGDCAIPADAGFRGTENQHYRVEIHDGGPVGEATFKWSRENGSVAARWAASDGDELTLSSPGRDAALGFAEGDWVELVDDGRELVGEPGTLVRLSAVRENVLVIDADTATGTTDRDDFPLNPKVRRWDSDGLATVAVPAGNDGWIALENGVEVHWSASGTFTTGDFWSVPARTTLGDVLWPRDGGAPAELPPFGEPHRFAPLALLRFDGEWTRLADCRSLFPPATELTSLFYAGGDGQQVAPTGALVPLPRPLSAGVSNGGRPVAGARVRFRVTAGGGRVGTASEVVATTDSNGIASTPWSVDSTTPSQQVTATLLGAAGTAVHLPIVFGASLLTAQGVAYRPECAGLAGTDTVQEALDRLCEVGNGGCATITVTPGPGWDKPLRSLPAGAGAHVCFRPGVFELSETLALEGLGDVLITGAGPGTRITAPKLEIALLFSGCTSVTLRDIGVAAGVAGIDPERPSLNGAVTCAGCPHVRVEAALLECASGPRRAATCLTVRPGPEGVAVETARVRDCELVAGHMQVGVLAVDVLYLDVSGNRLTVGTRPGSLGFERMLEEPDRRRALARQLYSGPLSGAALRGPLAAGTKLAAGRFAVGFDSPVPEHEWQALAAASPPSADELESADGVRAWAARLADAAVERPDSLPTFARQQTALRRRIGASEHDRLKGDEGGRALLRSTLVAGDVEVVDVSEASGRSAAVVVGGRRVAFDSVLSSAEWREVLDAGGVREVEDDAALRAALEGLAARAVVDPGLRARVPALGRWFQSLVDDNPPVAAQGVVVGGRVAETAGVRDNVFSGVAEAVHVGLSRGGTSLDIAGRVAISGNACSLRVPAELAAGARAIFVGNARHVVVEDNRVGVEGKQFREGVRVWGVRGPMMRVADNELGGCGTGVRVAVEGAAALRRRWIVSGNVAPQAEVAVSAPASVTRVDNVP